MYEQKISLQIFIAFFLHNESIYPYISTIFSIQIKNQYQIFPFLISEIA